MQTVRYGFLEAVQPFSCIETEGDRRIISEEFGMHPKATVPPFIGTEIEVTAAINFLVYFHTVRTVWHEF
jgi:hypothetical protein